MNLQDIYRQIEKVEVTAEDIKKSPRRAYNPTAWDSKIDWYASFQECRFYFDEEKNEYFAVYKVSDNSPRFMQVIMYSSMLTASGFQNGFIGDKYIFFYKYNNGLSIENSTENRRILSKNSSSNKSIFYWN